MFETFSASDDINVLTSSFPVPGLGLVPINAFVLKGTEPMLVDTCAGVQSGAFMPALRAVIDPADLKWLWLTHTDFDHIGSIRPILDENPNLRIITTFLGAGIMGLIDPLPMDRIYLLNPGEKISIGNRTLTAIRPPAFDNPVTTGFFDDRSKAFFSSDCFGAVLPVVPPSAADLPEADLRHGQVFWSTIDAPWLHKVDRTVFASELEVIRKMAPSMILSSHLPIAPGHMTGRLCDALASVPDAPPFVGPNQAALEAMMRGA